MKKIIGLCVNQISNGENYKRIQLLYKMASERDFQIVVFPIGTAINALRDKNHAEAFYWLESGRFDAILIDAKGMNNEEFVKALVRKAKNNHIPTVVINASIPATACVCSSVENGFSELVGHLIHTHQCKTFGFVGGMLDNSWNRELVQKRSEKLLEILQHTLKNGQLEHQLLYTKPQIMDKDEIAAFVADIVKQTLPDAIICGNDTTAVTICEMLRRHDVKVPEQVRVTGMGGSLRGIYNHPRISGCEQDYKEMVIAIIDILQKQQYGEKITETIYIEPLISYRESCGCIDETKEDYADVFNWMYDTIRQNEQYERSLFDFTEEFLTKVTIDEISKLLQKFMAKDAIVCVRDSFMQDIFSENNKVPDKNEKFYVLADTRECSKTWESFQLYELFPGLAESTEEDRLTFIIPINYQKSYYGYLIFCPHRNAERMFGMEKFSRNLNSTLGRYINERKLRFANHELICANENVKRMQIRDILTGLLNGNGFNQKMEELLEQCANQKIIVACIDLDRLANINDIYGHAEGDVAIQTIAHIIQEEIPQKALAARLGSDEFIVAIASETDQIMSIFEELVCAKLDVYNSTSDKEYSLEINYCQITINPTPQLQVKEILDEAFSRKRMLKENKRSRQMGNGYRGEESISREELQSVTQVLDNNEFFYAFQPIISAKNGAIVAYEALMRTSQEKKLTPLSILKCAAMDNRLYDIERLTLHNVMKIVKEQRELLGERKVFINSIPSNQLVDEDYLKIKHKYSDIMPYVVIEITEQTELDADGIDILRKRSTEDDFEVAIDDFGTGYSNTASLLRYLPNYVKIDRALVENMDTDTKKQHFIANIVEFAHDNGFLALAEGVETSAELAEAVRMGVDLIQGYYTARPTTDFLKETTPSIVEEIVRANIDGRESTRKKIFVVNKEKNVFLMQLATEQYTGMVVAQNELSLLGNSDFVAGVSIKIKDNTNCKLIIRNVKLCSENELPCIDLGNNVSLTLVLEGENEFYDRGIRIPETSKIRIEGAGNLSIISDSVDTYAIGNDVNKGFGGITFAMDGKLLIHIAGKRCIAIGGGYSSNKDGIRILKGDYYFDLAGLNSTAIGNANGTVPIYIENSELQLNIQIASGSGIGSQFGNQNILIKNCNIIMEETGNYICGIGSAENGGGSIVIEESNLTIRVDGRKIYLIGNESGDLSVMMKKCKVNLLGQASYVLGIGSYDYSACVVLEETDYSVDVKAGELIVIGAQDEKCTLIRSQRRIENGLKRD